MDLNQLGLAQLIKKTANVTQAGVRIDLELTGQLVGKFARRAGPLQQSPDPGADAFQPEVHPLGEAHHDNGSIHFNRHRLVTSHHDGIRPDLSIRAHGFLGDGMAITFDSP
jgi:hypothetical protein